MTTPFLAQDLRRDEGLRLEAYPDPVTRTDPWTIGYGHTGAEVREGLIWTESQAKAALVADIACVCGELDRRLPWWRELDDARQDVLANMAFNLGLGGLERFALALAAARAGRWQDAHDQLLSSDWAVQVGERAHRLAQQMLSGVRPT